MFQHGQGWDVVDQLGGMAGPSSVPSVRWLSGYYALLETLHREYMFDDFSLCMVPFNSLTPGGWNYDFKLVISKSISSLHILGIFWNYSQMNATRRHWWFVNMVQVMVCCRQQAITWAIVDPDLCCHKVSLSHNGSILVNFLPNPHTRHHIAHLWGWAMGCL